jgi:hypothetical protein
MGGLLLQSVFRRLAGYEDLNGADRLCRVPAMRWVVGEYGRKRREERHASVQTTPPSGNPPARGMAAAGR